MFDAEWKKLLTEVNENGIRVNRDSKRSFREIISYQFKLDNPLDRIIYNDTFGASIFQYIGQFLWISQGSFHTEEIAYYAPFSKTYSSDGITMIGAYGPRLFGIHHMNQIKHVTAILDEDLYRRRAVASIYLPQFDQHTSKDEVPCTLNLQYLIRENRVNAVTYMRSQNAYRLLPYDVFLFTMLQEYVNSILTTAHETKLGTYNHFSGSFHIYEDELPLIEETLKQNPISVPMEPMPSHDVILWVQKLNKFEALVRTTISSYKALKKNVDFDMFLETLDKSFFESYWKQMGLVLVCYGAIQTKNESQYIQLLSKLNSVYKPLVEKYVLKKNILFD